MAGPVWGVMNERWCRTMSGLLDAGPALVMSTTTETTVIPKVF